MNKIRKKSWFVGFCVLCICISCLLISCKKNHQEKEESKDVTGDAYEEQGLQENALDKDTETQRGESGSIVKSPSRGDTKGDTEHNLEDDSIEESDENENNEQEGNSHNNSVDKADNELNNTSDDKDDSGTEDDKDTSSGGLTLPSMPLN